ncbi:uncharacterized protein YueI [Peribacillus deserti]|uniref:Uncharacterized protein YueI n=1 Tax=Peribacillus deserti TaxID=673318 RepID=A0ABS2QK07_9BACI|nr:YueI family protein [Peribacillus deserti]MBM7693432.1 uncharacterized protein YueI [Peribacillus deserti]
MSKENVDDYLQQGIYGHKELKPEEKRKFLGTFRERVITALYIGQVTEKKVYKEVAEAINQYPNSALLLNGEITYSHISKYVKLANQQNIPYKVISNLENDTDIGLVLASKEAVDIENIYINKDIPAAFQPEEVKKKKGKGLFSFFQKK